MPLSRENAQRALTEALDELYGAPFEDFVERRRTLAAKLRSGGDVPGAREVLAAKKPSRTAWALNQLSRRRPASTQAAFEAHAAAAKAQYQADAGAMRETARAFRERVNDVVGVCAELLGESGAKLNALQARRLGETVRAAIAGGTASRERLLGGRLVEDIEEEDPFGGMEVGPHAAAPGRREPPRREASPAQAAEREKLERKGREREAREQEARDRHARRAVEAREATRKALRREVDAMEEAARQARASAREAEKIAARAQAEADRARRAVSVIEERLNKARAALGDA